ESEGADTEVEIDGSLIVNYVDFARRAVQDGLGLMYAPIGFVKDDVARGRLVQVLQEWMPAHPDSFFLYYPSRRQQPAALKALIDFLRANMRAGNGAPALEALPGGRQRA